MTCTDRRWCSVFWRSWARVIPHPRLPAMVRVRVRPNAEILNHGPPPAYARGQAAVGGAEPWPRVQPGVLRGLRAVAGLSVSGVRRPRPAVPWPRLNSRILDLTFVVCQLSAGSAPSPSRQRGAVPVAKS